MKLLVSPSPSKPVSITKEAQADSRSTPRFYGIQILRGLAAVLVVLHHQTQVAQLTFPMHLNLRLLDNGAFGVDIFFPISGFVMYLTAASIFRRGNPSEAWKDFLWRRFLRIAPLYWGCTILKLVLFVVVPSAMIHYRFMLWNTIAGFLFLPAYNYAHAPEPPLPVGWTLAYEMFFYLIVAMALAFNRPLLRWCASIIIALSLIGLFIPHSWGGWTYLADPIELEFLAGMFIAATISRTSRLPIWLPLLVLPAALVFALCYPVNQNLLEFLPMRPVVWGVPGVLILWSAAALESRLDLHRPLLLLLGDASFSLYLTHTFIVPAMRIPARILHLSGTPGLILYFVIGMAICLTVGVLVHMFVELPLQNVFSRYRRPFSTHSATT